MSQKHDPLGMKALMWIHLAERPLRINELRVALAVEPGDTMLDDENLTPTTKLLDCCLGLVVIDDETSSVRLVHYSLEEYFESTRFKEKYKETFVEDGLTSIAQTCLTYLNFAKLIEHCSTGEQVQQCLSHFAFLHYAACHWGNHTRMYSSLVGPLHESAEQLTLKLLKRRKLPCAVQVLYMCLLTPKKWKYDDSSESDSSEFDSSEFDSSEFESSEFESSEFESSEFGSSEFPYFFNDLFDSSECESSEFPYFFTGLHAAAYFGLGSIAGKLLTFFDIDAKDDEGRTPLYWACTRGHEDVASLLIASSVGRVDINSRDNRLQTPLLRAAEYGHESVSRLLINTVGIDVNAMDFSGMTPLLWAARRGHVAVTEVLLGHEDIRVNVNVKAGKTDHTALQAAVEGGHTDIVGMLLQKGAHVNAKPAEDDGRTALQAAAEGGHMDIVGMLLQKGADVNAKPAENDGRTALQAAVEGGHTDIVGMLLQKGTDVNAEPAKGDGRTALQAAVEGGHTVFFILFFIIFYFIFNPILHAGSLLNSMARRP